MSAFTILSLVYVATAFIPILKATLSKEPMNSMEFTLWMLLLIVLACILPEFRTM